MGVGASTNSITIRHLDNGTTYTFAVYAINGVGSGPVSAPSNAVVPHHP